MSVWCLQDSMCVCVCVHMYVFACVCLCVYMCVRVCVHHTFVNCMFGSCFQTDIVERFLWVGTGECEDYL